MSRPFYLAEWTGLSYTSAGRGIACKRFPSRHVESRAGGFLHSPFLLRKKKKGLLDEQTFLSGGVDGALLH